MNINRICLGLLCLFFVLKSGAQLQTYTPTWGANWSYTFSGLNPNKAYVLKVSGQYKPTSNNNAWERDAAWEFNTNGTTLNPPVLLSQNPNSTGNGGCEGRWTLNGVCQPYPTEALYNTFFPPTYDFWIPLNSSSATVAFWMQDPSQSQGNNFVFNLYERNCPIAGFNYTADTIGINGVPATYTLDAGAGYSTYNWSAGTANLFQVNTENYTVNRQFGWYRSLVTDVNGCVGEKSHYVSMLKAKMYQHDTTICSAAPITLSVDTSGIISSYIPTTLAGYTGPYVNTAGSGHTYFASVASTSWTQANTNVNTNATILQNGGHLAVINNAQEDSFVRSIIVSTGVSTLSSNYEWFGLYQDTLSPFFFEEAGGWSNVTGQPLTYTKWLTGEPNNQQGGSGPENYGQMWYDSVGWNDKPNAFNSPSVIEFEKRKISCLWSTGDTTISINVHPLVTTKYWFRITDGAASVTDTITVTITTPVKDTIKVNGCNGQTVYNGVTYNTSTVLNQTIKNKQGCDSVYLTVDINVTPINPITNTTNVTGCNSVVYKTITYTTTTTIRDTVKSYQGCDSIYNVTNIVVNKIIPANNNITVSGCNSVVYKGITYNASTILRDTVKSYQGCDSIYNITSINVNKITTTTNTNNVSGCNSVVYKGITYNASTIVRDTVKSYQGCDSIYNVANIIVNKIVVTTNNINLNGCVSVIYKGITYTSAAIVRDTVKSYQGCDSIYNVANIAVNKLTVVTNNINLSGCDSLTNKGVKYYASATLRDTVKSYQGCDSIYNVTNITVNKITVSTNTINLSGCNSVVYKGITYNVSAVVRDTAKSYQGCDSVYDVANINVNTIIVTTNNTSQSGCNAVTYKGVTYNASAVVRDTVKSYQGCDSVYNIATITVNKIVVTTNNTNLSGCNNVVYNGTTYNASVTLRDTVKSYQGCDSVYNIINIAVNPIVPVTQTFNFSGCNSVTYNGISFTTSTVLNKTLKSYQGCDSVYVVVNIVVTPIVPVTQTTSLSGCNNVMYNGTNYTSSTVLNQTIKSYQGCDSIYKVVNIVVTPIVPVTQTSTFSGCNSVTYNGTTYNSSTVLNQTLKSVQGCDSVYLVTNINVTPIVAVTQATNFTGCNSVVFNGITYTSSTVLTQTLKSVQGCDSVYLVANIIVTPIVPVTKTTTVSSCNSVTYNGTVYTSSTVLSQTLKSIQGCDSVYQTVNIVVNPDPVVSVLVPPVICLGSPVTSTYTSSINNIVSANWNMGNGAVYSNINLDYTYPKFGFYNIAMTVTDVNGCNSAPVKMLVNVLPEPVIENLHDTTVFSGATFQYNAQTYESLKSIIWQPYTYLSSDTVLNPVCSPLATTSYTVNVSDSNGCTATASCKVNVINIPEIPNVFSPNGDGNHDYWVFGNTTISNITEVKVFDRNGQIVYTNYNYDNSWNGTSGGYPLPIGTYYYIIKLNNIYTLSGWVLIIR